LPGYVINLAGDTRALLDILPKLPGGSRDPDMPNGDSQRQGTSTMPEDDFTVLFAQVFGVAKVLQLAHEFPVDDIYGNSRYVDYALRTPEEKVAFEIDGLTWHYPAAVPVEKFEDDLLRQNSLIHQGWRIFRWTDRQIQQEP